MTSTVNTTTQAFLDSRISELLATRIDVVATALLVILLIESELLSAYLGSAVAVRRRVLGVSIVPLLLIFAVIVFARTTSLR